MSNILTWEHVGVAPLPTCGFECDQHCTMGDGPCYIVYRRTPRRWVAMFSSEPDPPSISGWCTRAAEWEFIKGSRGGSHKTSKAAMLACQNHSNKLARKAQQKKG